MLPFAYLTIHFRVFNFLAEISEIEASTLVFLLFPLENTAK